MVLPIGLLVVLPHEGLILKRHWEADTSWVEVLHAEPRVTFAAGLLGYVRRGSMPGAYLDRPAVGGTLRITARNRTVIYRLTGQDEEHGTFTGEWPD